MMKNKAIKPNLKGLISVCASFLLCLFLVPSFCLADAAAGDVAVGKQSIASLNKQMRLENAYILAEINKYLQGINNVTINFTQSVGQPSQVSQIKPVQDYSTGVMRVAGGKLTIDYKSNDASLILTHDAAAIEKNGEPKNKIKVFDKDLQEEMEMETDALAMKLLIGRDILSDEFFIFNIKNEVDEVTVWLTEEGDGADIVEVTFAKSGAKVASIKGITITSDEGEVITINVTKYTQN